MVKRRRYLLACLLLLGMIPAAQAQELGAGAFGSEMKPPPAPEFCPPPHKEQQRTSTVPFDNLCPVGNAFSTLCPTQTNQPAWYLGLGGMALRPVGMSKETVATFRSTGEAIGFQDVPTQYAWGIRGNVGFNFGPNAVEISGYYLIPQPNLAASVAQGDINVFFGKFPAPPGFAGSGTGSVWLGADRLEIARTWEVGNLEANYRHCFFKGVELLAGFRYFDYRDKVSIFTDQHAVTGTSPLTQATYNLDAHSHIIAPQLGFECEKSLVSLVSVGVTGKAAVGPNFLNIEQTLARGDGFPGPSGGNSETTVSGVFDLSLYMHFWFNETFRLRLGYDFLWLVAVPEAQHLINFDPNVAGGAYDRHGSQVFHGPQFEFQLAF